MSGAISKFGMAIVVAAATPAAAQDSSVQSSPEQGAPDGPDSDRPQTDSATGSFVVTTDAQSTAEDDRTDRSRATRRSYTPEDFARFAPRNALDMARQVPGFSISEGGNSRGLGQADTNVLINRRRISGKSNGAVEALQRIPVDDVVRLELVDGASLDIGGLSGQVLNVVSRNSGRITGQFRYSAQARSKGTPARLLDGSIALAGGGAKTEWTLALENDSNRRGNDGIELVFDGAGNLIDTRDEKENNNTERPSLSGSFTRIADSGNVLNLTGVVEGNFRDETEISLRSGTVEPIERVRTFNATEEEFSYEVGVDYQFKLGSGRLKLIAFNSFENSPTVSQTITEFADGSPAAGSVFTRNADEGETILRSEYNVGALGGDMLFAAEGVRNFLDINAALEERDAAGVLQPVVLQGATARVEEDRADFGVTYSRQLATNLQLQMSGGAEYSQISQSGPLGQTRNFWRPKGFAGLDFKAGDRVNISGRVERQVGQLSFFDFIATVDLNQDREDVTNANLVPQQSWVLEVEASIGLGALGSLNLRPFYEDITDIVDQIPIAGGGQAPGNLPSAQFYGLDTDLTLLSEPLGWRGTRFDVGLFLTDSAVEDPLTGETRKLSNNTLVNIDADLRHDFFGSVWAVGGSLNWNDRAERVRIDEISLRGESFAFLNAFVENKDVAGLTMRLSVANLVDRQNFFDRTVFLDRAAGIVDFVEDQDRNFGMIFSYTVEGTF